MRRKDREISDPIKIEEVIKQAHCMRLGFNDQGEVYIVPLTYGYIKQDDHYTFYFHSAKAGRKVDLVKQNPYVGFEIDEGYQLHEATIACDYSCSFISIIGNGNIKTVEGEEKLEGLKQIMKKQTGKEDWDFDPKRVEAIHVFKLEVTKLSCKEHL